MPKFSVTVCNARGDAIATAIGASPILRLRTGVAPANCASADTGTVCWQATLASNWASPAAAGTKSFSGTPISAASINGGPNTLGHYRLYDASGVTCHYQGSITLTGGGGDLTVDAITTTAPQVVNITSWSITDGNL